MDHYEPTRLCPAKPESIGVVLHDFSLGGTERIALRLSRCWADSGVEVTIFCGDMSGPLRKLVDQRVQVIAANPPIRRGPNSRGRLAKAAAKFFTCRPVETAFIIGNFHWRVALSIAKMDEVARPKVVAQVSSPLHKPQRGKLAQSLFEFRMRHYLKWADLLITLDKSSAQQANRIMGRRMSQEVPLPALSAEARPSQAIPGSAHILAAGRLSKQKDFATLLRAFAKVKTEGATLSIAGSGPLERTLRSQARRLGIASRVNFVGYVDDIFPLLDKATLFVLSSAYEGYPAVLIEALGAGRPVVATDCTPAVHDLLANRPWGAVVPIGDSTALAEAIDTQLQIPNHDVDEISATVKDHAISSIASMYLDLFASPFG